MFPSFPPEIVVFAYGINNTNINVIIDNTHLIFILFFLFSVINIIDIIIIELIIQLPINKFSLLVGRS